MCESSSIFFQKDYRSIIDTFLDYPNLHTLLITIKPDNFKTVKQYTSIVKRKLKEKSDQCRISWYFHQRMPDEQRLVEKMHVHTLQNIRKLENHGFIWQSTVNTWKIPRGIRYFGSDMMLKGKHPKYGIVHYWRHETKHPGAGQSFLLWWIIEEKKGKMKRVTIKTSVSHYLRDH